MKRLMHLLVFLCLYLSVQAQEDTIKANRYVMRSTLYGVGHINILDTYLYTPLVVALSLILYGILFILLEKCLKASTFT